MRMCSHQHPPITSSVLNHLIPLFIFLIAPHSSSASPSSSLSAFCNPRDHALFVADPTDRQAFLQCRAFNADDPSIPNMAAADIGATGFWTRHFCPNDMHFEQDTQQCTANTLPPGIVREANDMFQIAILNGSCTRGEHCIGGTVCDQSRGRCLCPYGTVAIVESLSCAKVAPPPPQQQQQSGVYQQPYITAYSNGPMRSNTQWPLYYGARPYAPPPAPQNPMVMTMPTASAPWTVPPGASCARGEQCGGGSVCVAVAGGAACICPAGMQNNGGQCVQMPGMVANKPPQNVQEQQMAKEMLGQSGFLKVPLGERCNEYLGVSCADPSALCVDSRCQCVPPMLEQAGHCQMPPTSGPGEQCGAGEMCARGSVCDMRSGLCVCPPGTELALNGWCSARAPSTTTTESTTTTTEMAPAPMLGKMVPISSTESPSPPAKQPSRRQRPKEEVKVGERCSLNADCIAGAYCNGNTQPPTCQCLSTHVSVDNRCEKVIYPGQRGCETDLQCAAGYAGTRCIGRQCVCPPGSSAIGQTCIPAIAWPGEACNVTRLMPVCSADAYCFEGRCVCNPPLRLFQKQCIQRGEIGVDEDEEADEKQGKTRKDESEADEKIKRKKGIEEDEKVEKMIRKRKKDGGSGCKRDEQCPRGHICAEKRGRCERCGGNRKLDRRCGELEEIGGKFEDLKVGREGMNDDAEGKKEAEGKSEASSGSGMDQLFATLALLRNTARRRSDLMKQNDALMKAEGEEKGRPRRESEDEEGMMKKRKKDEKGKRKKRIGKEPPESIIPHEHRLEGEPCKPEHFCLSGTECVDGICQRMQKEEHVATFRPIDATCLPSRDRCTGGSVCTSVNGTSTCKCTDDAWQDGDRCRQAPGGKCGDGQICGGRARCRQGKCQCRAGMRATDGEERKRKRCVRMMAGPGQSCGNGEKCVGGAECGFGKICLCPTDHQIVNGTKCERTGKESGNENRTRTEERKLTEAQDDDPQKGEEDEGENKLISAMPGELCVPGSTKCTGGAKCWHGICTCPDGHTLFRDECQPPRAVPISGEQIRAQAALFTPAAGAGAGAAMDSPAAAAHDEEHGADELENNSLQDPVPTKTVAPGAMCRLSLECPYRTECMRAVCRCQPGETIVNGMCRKTIHEVLPGGRCDTQKGLDCVGESHCFYGICVCLYGLVNIGNECANVEVLERVSPGKRCVPGQYCQGRSKCTRGRCQCPKGLKVDAELKRCVKSPRTPSPTATLYAAYPAEEGTSGTATTAELVPSVLEIPLRNSPGDHGGGTRKAPAKWLYAIPAALAAAAGANSGADRTILTANSMSINLLDQHTLRGLLANVGTAAAQQPQQPDGCDATSTAPCPPQSPTVFVNATPPTVPSPAPHFHSRPNPSSPGQYTVPDASTLLSRLRTLQSPPQMLGQPGWACAPGRVCHGGAFCLADLCICRPGFRPIDGLCQIARVALGQQCFINEQCGASGYCIEGVCRCRAGDELQQYLPDMPPHSRQERCPNRPLAAAGDDCTHDQACSWNSICGTFSGVCECAVGMESDQGACVAARRPRGSECLASSDCQSPGKYCDNGFCICRRDHASIGAFCLPPARPIADDPKAYIDPDAMAMLLRNTGKKVTEEGAVGSPFGGAFSRRIAPADTFRNELSGQDNTFGGQLGQQNSVASQFGPDFGAQQPSTLQQNNFGSEFGQRENLTPEFGQQQIGFSNNFGQFGQSDFRGQQQPFGQSNMPIEFRGQEFGMPNQFGRGFGGQQLTGNLVVAEDGNSAVPMPEAAYSAESEPANTILKNAWGTLANALTPNGGGRPAQPQQNPPRVNVRAANRLAELLLAAQNGAGSGLGSRRGGRIPAPLQHFPPMHHKGTHTLTLTGDGKAKKHHNGKDHTKHGHGDHHPHSHDMAMPGEYCGTQERQCAGNAICLKGWCQCPEGVHIERGGMCADDPGRSMMPPSMASSSSSHSVLPQHRLPNRPFQSCFANRPCIHGATCVRSAALPSVQKLGPYCQCSSGLIFLQDQCIQRRPEMRIAQPGDPCPPPVICDAGSVCGDRGICACPAGLKLITGLCVHVALPGESCASGEFCADGAICAPGLDACVCQVGWHVRGGKCRKGKKKRMRKQRRGRGGRRGAVGGSNAVAEVPRDKLMIPLGESCVHDSDCAHVHNAFCSHVTRRCVCSPGFQQLYASICVPEDRIRLPGEECVSSAHFCAADSWCKDGVCACIQRNARAVDGHCMRTRKWRRRRPTKVAAAETEEGQQFGELEPIACESSEVHCPPGAVCAKTEAGECACTCNGQVLQIDAERRRMREAEEWQCGGPEECPWGLTCQSGRCICERNKQADELNTASRPQPQLPANIIVVTTPSWREENAALIGKKEDGDPEDEREADEEEAADPEWDYALGQPVMAHPRARSQGILPGAFCDAFSRCGDGAECFFGRCQCIFRGHRLAFVDGSTKCVKEDPEEEAETGTGQRVRRHHRDLLALVVMDSDSGSTVPEAQKHWTKRHAERQRSRDFDQHPPPPANCSTSNSSSCPQHYALSQHPSLSSMSAQKRVVGPGDLCGPLDSCAGGAACVEGMCLCPAGTRPSPSTGHCETFAEQRRTTTPEAEPEEVEEEVEEPITQPAPIKALNRHQLTAPKMAEIPEKNAAHGNESSLNNTGNNPMGNNNNNTSETMSVNAKDGKVMMWPQITRERPYARPSESCASGEICTGGSICQQQDEAKICQCPPTKSMLRNHICIRSDEPPMIRAREVRAGEPCNSETKCTGNSICADGICRCRNGHIAPEGGQCGAAAASAKALLPPVQLAPEGVLQDQPSSASAPSSPSSSRHRSPAVRPRISGPPLRRPSTIEATASPAALSMASAGTSGVCPPGNSPLMDKSSGRLVQCNGMTPNCPPKSYCFVTGVASETYNCCKAY